MSWDKEAPKKNELRAASVNGWDSEPPPPSIPLMTSAQRGAEQGATLGWYDELAGVAEAAGQAVGVKGLGANSFDELGLQSPNLLDPEAAKQAYLMRRDAQRREAKTAREANPASYVAGEIAGGIATAPLIPGGAAKTVGQATKAAAAYGAAAGLGASDAKSVGGQALDSAVGGTVGAIVGLVGGTAVDKTAKAIERATKKVKPILEDFVQAQTGRKANAKEIEAAAKALGIDATPGMLSAGEQLQGLESSLSQSPTLAGYLVNRKTSKVVKALEKVPQEVLADATNLDSYQVGEAVKRGIAKKVTDRAAAVGKPFQELAESTREMVPSAKSLERVAKNIANIDEARLIPGSRAEGLANRYAEAVKGAKTIDDIKRIRSIVGKDLETALAKQEGLDAQALGAIYDKLTRLEESSIMRGAVETMRGFAQKPTGKTGEAMALEGGSIGADMIANLRAAKRDYAQFMNELRGVADAANLGKVKGPKGFTSTVEGIQSEKVASKLFNTSNRELMAKVKALAPEEFELLRQAKLASIAAKSEGAKDNLIRNQFYRQLKGIDDAPLRDLVGAQNFDRIQAAKIVDNALPAKMGPSGTPQGLDYQAMLNPVVQGRDAARYALYKSLSGKNPQEVAKKLLQLADMKDLAARDPKSFGVVVRDLSRRSEWSRGLPKAAQNPEEGEDQKAAGGSLNSYDMSSEAPRRGPDKWTADGFEKILQASDSAGRKALEANAERLLSSAKGKRLLMQASDLKPGTKAFEKIQAEIRAEIKRGEK